MTAATARLREVADHVKAHRYVYGNEDDLQAALAGALGGRWRVEREYPMPGGRLDLYLPEVRLGVEVKVAGSPGDVRRQVERYLSSDRIDGLLLVTSRVRHSIPPCPTGKPVEVVWIAAGAL